MTAAKIGRSMKKCEMFMGCAAAPGGGVDASILPGCGVTFCPGRARNSPLMMT